MAILSSDIRSKYLEFYKAQGHAIVPSAPLVPENDPTTLFTGSGMQPMLPYLLGERHPLGKRIADSQKCFRAVDMEEVGDNRHTTFFEMLGNWSLGDYFKNEQIHWMWSFLVGELGLDPKKLYFTCHNGSAAAGIERDDTAANLWIELYKSVGIDAKTADNAANEGMKPGERIFFYEDKKNWWSRAGIPANMPAGEPGGPDSEMFWDFDPTGEKALHENSPWKDQPCHVNCDCGRFLEIGNNVFMAYMKEKDGTFSELTGKNIDFGGGLERIAMALADSPDIFKTGIFDLICEKLESVSHKTYGTNPDETQAFRIIMDHLRAATFLIGDDVVPSNVDAGYFVRRLIRRAVRAGRKLAINERFCGEVASAVIETYQDVYTNLATKRENILRVLVEEEEKFEKTLERGEREIEKILASGAKIDGKKAFWLFETYGFPREMTEEIILEHLMTQYGLSAAANVEIMREKLFAVNPELAVEMKTFASAFDTASLEHAELSRTAGAGKFKGGLADQSDETTALHTACHLMLAGLRKILGAHVHQAGSNITAERLRFDFTHPEKVTPEQLAQIEQFVNDAIDSGLTVTISEEAKEAAKDRGVEGAFWEKYPDVVTVYKMQGGNGVIYSEELCGGPHVETSATMGRFKIQKEESSSSGVRRIKAVLEK